MCLDPVMWPLGHFSLQLLDPCSAALTPPFCIACSALFWLLYKTRNPALFLACSLHNVLLTFLVLCPSCYYSSFLGSPYSSYFDSYPEPSLLTILRPSLVPLPCSIA